MNKFTDLEQWPKTFRPCSDGPNCGVCRAMARAVGAIVIGANPWIMKQKIPVQLPKK